MYQCQCTKRPFQVRFRACSVHTYNCILTYRCQTPNPSALCVNKCFRLQRVFFVAYFLALFSDWVKGAYIYALYSSYGYDQSQIALLYVTGFASSGLFGTFTGCLADSLGRRNMALVFTLVYALSALCKERNKNTEPWATIIPVSDSSDGYLGEMKKSP